MRQATLSHCKNKLVKEDSLGLGEWEPKDSRKSLHEIDSDHREQHRGGGKRQCFKEVLMVYFVAGGLSPIFPPKEVTPGLVLQKCLQSFGRKYTLAMGYAGPARLGKGTMMLYIQVG